MMIAVLSTLAFAAPLAAGSSYPLRVSANRRYLIDAQGKPFLMVGDSAWSLLVNLNMADTSYYLHSRATNGFNTVMCSLISVPYTGGRSDGTMLNGTAPFTNYVNGQFDLAAVNPAYLSAVSNVVLMAATNGLILMIDPLDTGGLLACARTNGPAKCLAYGQMLGNYFGNFTNVVWQSGNDYNYDDPQIVADDACMTNIVWGIKITAPAQLHTANISGTTVTSDGMLNTNWWPLLDLTEVYTWAETYDMALSAYSRTNFRPAILGEAHYEAEYQGWPLPPAYYDYDSGTPPVIRRQIYWTMTCGGCGHLYGHHDIWTFTGAWKAELNTAAVQHLNRATAFFSALRWWDLVPDTNHAVLKSGYGTYDGHGQVSTNDYATAARTLNGAVAVVYVPTVRTITVDLSTMVGPVTVRWFDPTSASFYTIGGSPLPNSGVQDFTPPGSNGSGDGDWLLLLEAQTSDYRPLITSALSSSNSFLINFTTYTGQVYDLQCTAALDGSSWLVVISNIIGTGGVVQVVDTNTAGQSRKFYRVRTMF
jgi:hypothetical protein